MRHSYSAESDALSRFGLLFSTVLLGGLISACSALPPSPYKILIEQGDVNTMRDILAKEPRLIRSADALGWTFLHYAVFSKSPNSLVMCKLLVGAGAEINASGNQGNTPLHFAAYRVGREELSAEVYNGIIALLLDNGASVESENMIAATPLHSAVNRGADPSAVEMLLTSGANVNAKTVGGGAYAPLHAAAANGRADLVEILLNHGANRDLKDGRGKTPLEMAVEQGHLDVVPVFNVSHPRP